MGFKEVNDFETDRTVSLGGINKKTGKPNPTSAEGFFLGTKTVESKMARSGTCSLYILKTPEGNLGVWGKTDLDRKMETITPGVLIRMSFAGTRKIPGKNDMYKYKVEVDEDQTVEVAVPQNTVGKFGSGEAEGDTPYEEQSAEPYAEEETEYELDASDEEEAAEATPPPRAKAPAKAASAPSADQQARVKALLAGKVKKSA